MYLAPTHRSLLLTGFSKYVKQVPNLTYTGEAYGSDVTRDFNRRFTLILHENFDRSTKFFLPRITRPLVYMSICYSR
jgi:hypothetical protein